MKKPITSALLGTMIVLWLAASASAANWYVRPGGAGSKTGADWNNAWDVGSIGWSSVSGGDTVWLAGGTYTSQVHPTSSGRSTNNPIYVRRVQAADSVPVAAAGWNTSFDNQVIIAPPNSSPVWYYDTTGEGNYMYIDGRVDSGISIQNPNIATAAYNGCVSIGVNYSSQHDIVLTNMDLAGPEGSTGIVHTSYDNCLHTGLAGLANSNIFCYYCRFHGAMELLNLDDSQNIVFDHCKFYDNNGTSPAGHEDTIETYGGQNLVVRFCEFWNWGPDGWLMDDTLTGCYIYDNLFHDASGRALMMEATGQNIYFYNNTLVNLGANAFQDSAGGGYWASGACENNIYWNTSVGNQFPSFANYDYSDTALGEPNGVTGTGATPFVNYQGENYQIVGTIASNYPRQKGANLGAPYNVDYLGVVRPVAGAWDIGAYEYGSSSSPRLTITHSKADVVLTWPTNAAGFTLQFTMNLGPSAVWTSNSPAPVVVNGQDVVTNPIAGSHMFFRLSR